MYSIVRIFEGDGHPASDGPAVAPARVGDLFGAAGLVTLLAIKGDDGALVTVEIFETADDLRIAQADTSRADPLLPFEDPPARTRTISGEIVFQRGL